MLTLRIVQRIRPLYLVMHGFFISMQAILRATFLLGPVLVTLAVVDSMRAIGVSVAFSLAELKVAGFSANELQHPQCAHSHSSVDCFQV